MRAPPAWMPRAAQARRTEPAVGIEERRLAGVVSGALYLIGGLTMPVLCVLPGISHAHELIVLSLAAAAAGWGLCSVRVIDWERAPSWLIHVSVTAGLGVIAAAVASSGGAVSPAWVYLFFAAVFAAYFFEARVALVYLVACVITQALALAYDHRAAHPAFIAQLLIASGAYLVLGDAIIAGRRLMQALRMRTEALAAEQGALRRVATAVVGGEPADRIYELVSMETAALLGGGAAGVLRFEDEATAIVMGSWADHPSGRYETGRTIAILPGSDIQRARDSGEPVRIDSHPPDSAVDRLGYRSSIVAPVQVHGRSWGALAITGAASAAFTERDQDRLMAFGDLLATAIANLEDRAKLAAQASSDTLTGLLNHRTLQEVLAREAARSVRHQRPLSVAVIDIDHFKQINDRTGHEAGDRTLRRVAECLRNLAREEDTLGRVGGDEFAWILPDSRREQALVAVERARQAIARSSPNAGITVSAGICDTSVTKDPAELIRLADGALYWSKAHGRNQCWVYDPDVIDELSAEERAERLERQHAVVGLRALARAIDAKDPGTSRHSERVAELVAKLARAAGWPEERARLLGEAALVHDVGKIGIPDSLLREPRPLTSAEREHVQTHAELAARIVEDVLAPEQVDWIRTHHERPDGTGYPRGLEEADIPEGAALLALADAWDVMTMSRPYCVPKTADEAIAECTQLVGLQFTAVAVAALVDLYAAGDLLGEELAVNGVGSADGGTPSPRVLPRALHT